MLRPRWLGRQRLSIKLILGVDSPGGDDESHSSDLIFP